MMANLGSLLHSPGTQPDKHLEEKTAQLVLLRTDTGAIYVRPSAWQRIRLQWIFRNFHVLSTQVLSRRDQRLIAQLARFAVVTPVLPVSGTSVLGVIEKAHTRLAEAADPVFGMATAGERRLSERKSWSVSFGLVGALTAICVTVILMSALASRTRSIRKAPAAKPLAHGATLLPASASQPLAATRQLVIPTEANAAFLLHRSQQRPGGQLSVEKDARSSPMTPPMTSPSTGNPGERGGETCCTPSPLNALHHPVVAQEKEDGEVQLKLLIGTDGGVKAVTVVRGDPRLAEAGMRAVRRWHYRPAEELGRPVEVERQVTMKFFGPDAVSIASVTNPSAAVLR